MLTSLIRLILFPVCPIIIPAAAKLAMVTVLNLPHQIGNPKVTIKQIILLKETYVKLYCGVRKAKEQEVIEANALSKRSAQYA
jgi:hypothetical protein